MRGANNPYRTPAVLESESLSPQRGAEHWLLLAMGVIMGVELVGVPLLVVLVLSLGLEAAGTSYWFVLSVLASSAVAAGVIFAKLLRLAKPSNPPADLDLHEVLPD
jgi:hypothetical protein